MRKLTSLLFILPLALGLSSNPQDSRINKQEKDPFENAKEIRIKSAYIKTMYKGIYDGGDYGPGLVDYANECKKDSTKSKEKIPDKIWSYYLLTKTGNDTITLDVNNLYYPPSHFREGVYYKEDASKLIYLRDSLHPRVVLSLVKALVNEQGDTLELIKLVRSWDSTKDHIRYVLEGVNKPSQIKRIN